MLDPQLLPECRRRVPQLVDGGAAIHQQTGDLPAAPIALSSGIPIDPPGVSRSAPASTSTTATSTSSVLAARCSGVSGRSPPQSSLGSAPAPAAGPRPPARPGNGRASRGRRAAAYANHPRCPYDRSFGPTPTPRGHRAGGAARPTRHRGSPRSAPPQAGHRAGATTQQPNHTARRTTASAETMSRLTATSHSAYEPSICTSTVAPSTCADDSLCSR